MFQQVGPEDTFIISRLIEALKEKGAAVGRDDIVKAAGYGLGGVSGLAASGEILCGFLGTKAGVTADLGIVAILRLGPFGLQLLGYRLTGHGQTGKRVHGLTD